MSELPKRILFAVVAAPVAATIIYRGGAALATLLSLFAAVAAWEYCRIARAAGAEPFDYLTIVGAAAVPLFVHGTMLGVFLPTMNHLVVAALAVLAATVFLRGAGRRPLLAASTTIFGVMYTSLVAYVYVLRYHPYTIDAISGTALVMLPILITWATDIGAYAFGRVIGGRKLIPSVSPGKTMSGAVGGLLLATIMSIAYMKWVLHPYAQLTMPVISAAIFGATLSAVAQVGDLAESLVKREAGVKDSGGILPGHGGVLDRLDSLLFVLPVATLMLQYLLVPAPV